MKSNRILRPFLGALALFAVTSAWAEPEPNLAFVPPDFYHHHRQELELSDEQLEKMQAIAEETHRASEETEKVLRERMQAFNQSLSDHPAKVDLAADKLKSVLAVENEIKILQLRARLAIRNTLSPAQFDKASHLIRKHSEPQQGASARLQEKLRHVREQIHRRAEDGHEPREWLHALEKVEQAARGGRVGEAEERLDGLLREMHGGAGNRERAEREGRGGAEAREAAERAARAEREGRGGAEAREAAERAARAEREGRGGAEAREAAERAERAEREGRGGAEAREAAERAARAEREGRRGAEGREAAERAARAEREGRGGAEAREAAERAARAERVGRERAGGAFEARLRGLMQAAEKTEDGQLRQQIQGALEGLHKAREKNDEKAMNEIFSAIEKRLDQGR